MLMKMNLLLKHKYSIHLRHRVFTVTFSSQESVFPECWERWCVFSQQSNADAWLCLNGEFTCQSQSY